MFEFNSSISLRQVHQNTEVGVITETGRHVRLFAEEVLRLEPGLVQTLLLSLVDYPVLERELIHENAIPILVEVNFIISLIKTRYKFLIFLKLKLSS